MDTHQDSTPSPAAIDADQLIIVSGFELADTSATERARQLRDEILTKARRGKKIDSAQSMQRAAEILTELKTFSRAIEDRRKIAKAPVIELGKRIEALASELAEQIDAEADRISRMLGTYQQEQKRLEQEDQRKAFEKEQAIIAEANRVAEQKKKEAAEAQAAIDLKAAEEAEAARVKLEAAKAELDAKSSGARSDRAKARLDAQKAELDKLAAEEAEAARVKAEKEKAELAAKSAAESEKHTEKVEDAIVANRVAAAGLAVEKPSGIATGDTIEFEVTDIHELYSHQPALVVLTPQKAAIKNALKSLRKDQTLPGIRHWRVAKAVVRNS